MSEMLFSIFAGIFLTELLDLLPEFLKLKIIFLNKELSLPLCFSGLYLLFNIKNKNKNIMKARKS